MFKRPDRGHDHHGVGLNAAFSALDVHEFLCAQVGAETGLGNGVFRQPHGHFRGDDAVAPVGDVGEWPAVDKRRIVFQGLHQVRLQGVFQQHGHCAVGFKIGRGYGFFIAGVGDNDPPQPLLEILERLGQAEAGHYFRGHGDVKTAFMRHAVVGSAQTDDDVAQCPVVHIHHPFPDDAPGIDVELISLVDVVVDQRGQQIVGKFDGVEIAGEMEVYVLHGHDLGITAAGRTAFHAEARAQRRLAQAYGRFLADAVQPVAQSYAGGCFAFAGGRGRDGRYQNQLAGWAVVQAMIVVQRDFCLEFTIMLRGVVGNAQLGGDFLDGEHFCAAGNFNIRRKCA